MTPISRRSDRRTSCSHVHAVDEDAARRRVVEPRNERGERRLARAGAADERHRSPCRDAKVDVLEHESVGVVSERDVLEHDLARAWRKSARFRSVRDLLGLVEDLEDPLACRDRPLRLADPHAEHPQRHDEHREQEIEGGERSQRHRARDDHPSADEQHESERDHRKEREQGDVDRALAIRRERLREDGVGGGCEAIRPRILLRERLDDVNAGDRLLGDGRDLTERLLDVAEHGLRHEAVAIRRPGRSPA